MHTRPLAASSPHSACRACIHLPAPPRCLAIELTQSKTSKQLLIQKMKSTRREDRCCETVRAKAARVRLRGPGADGADVSVSPSTNETLHSSFLSSPFATRSRFIVTV